MILLAVVRLLAVVDEEKEEEKEEDDGSVVVVVEEPLVVEAAVVMENGISATTLLLAATVVVVVVKMMVSILPGVVEPDGCDRPAHVLCLESRFPMSSRQSVSWHRRSFASHPLDDSVLLRWSLDVPVLLR